MKTPRPAHHARLDTNGLELRTVHVLCRPSEFLEAVRFVSYAKVSQHVLTDLTLLWLSFLAWICRIRSRADSLGRGNSIFRSNLPDRKRAGSRMSIRFVAAMTWISCERSF